MKAQATVRRETPLSAFMAGSALLLVAACASPAGGGDPPGVGQTSSNTRTAVARGDADAGYFGCARDSDCVAVRLLSGCCNNGWKIAVAGSEAAAYLKATACAESPRHFCPQYIVNDTRVPACDQAELRCMMVASDGGTCAPPEVPAE